MLRTFDDIAHIYELKAFASNGKVGFIINDAKPYSDSYTIDSWFWVTDGTAPGTVEIQDNTSEITPDGESYLDGWASKLMVADERLIYLEGDSQVWSSDGTVAVRRRGTREQESMSLEQFLVKARGLNASRALEL